MYSIVVLPRVSNWGSAKIIGKDDRKGFFALFYAMRFRKKELRKLLGRGHTHTHTRTNNITKHYISRYRNLMLPWLVGFFPPWNVLGWSWQCCNGQERRKRRFTLLGWEGNKLFWGWKGLMVESRDWHGVSRQSRRGNRCLSGEKLNCFQTKRREISVVDSSFLPLPPRSAALAFQAAVVKLFCLQPHLPHVPTHLPQVCYCCHFPSPHKSQ